ncbi:MAG: UDP-N-acetylmuramate--L-alanine ligase [Nitrospirae bacterium]|nr:UDP-N-acetylmuramate--L-alanine ligase [Nitrospirota bacterium]
MFNQYRVIHFVGIGGIGMSGIAEVLHNIGYEVAGSDVKASANTERLAKFGIKIFIGHKAENIDSAHVVVVSSAISTGNPEVLEAKRRSIPVIPRAEMLAELGRLKYSILIAGSHGKTTTTSLISTVLLSSGYDPTVVIGGKLIATDSNAIPGKGEFLVAEADESDGSFLKLNPTIAVCTNIDREHMDYFHNMEKLKESFVSFLNKIPFYGLSVVSLDDPNVREILPFINRRYTTYGLTHDADFEARNVRYGFMNSQYDLYHKGDFLAGMSIPLSGKHNVLNSLATVAVATYLHVDMETVKESLRHFKGIKRRLEYKGEVNGVKIFDDYGHHPTEIRMTLKGIKEHIDGKLVVLFQPHRYTRTRDLLDEFAHSFGDVDRVYLMDVYSAGEKPIDGVGSPLLAGKMQECGVDVKYMPEVDAIVDSLDADLSSGDYLITFGAGDVWKYGENLLLRGKN